VFDIDMYIVLCIEVVVFEIQLQKNKKTKILFDNMQTKMSEEWKIKWKK